MKKRTPVTVALLFLIATLTGYVQVAASTPAQTLTAPATPAPLPAIAEQTGLVIGPGQVGRLSLPLNVGDRVDGKVTVVPEDVNFVIEDPDGKMVLNAGRITERDFSFVAATSGNYQLIFGNTIFLVANKVVLVKIQHRGPQLFPYFAGTYAAVKAGEIKTLTVELAANRAVRGSLKIQGGQQELVFTASDPNGNTAVSASSVYGSYTIAFTTAVAGIYQLSFDNRLSPFTSKLVSIELATLPGGQILWWGTSTKLVFSTPPGGAIAGSEFTTQPVVTVQDADGNIATNSFASVTLAITSATGASGAVLSGTTTVIAQSGVATFSGLGINLARSGYTLTATASGLSTATSSAFNVAPVLPPNCIALNSGWNLISLPLIPRNTEIASVLSGISSSVKSVWHYDGASARWSNYLPALGGTLSTMKDGKAYWVNMSAPAILSIDGSELPAPRAASPTYPVVPGWNMIGFKSTSPRAISAYLTGNDYRVFPMYGYASGAFLTVSPSADSMQPGVGYWVYFNAAGVIRP